MIHDGRVEALPLTDYTDTKANIAALAGLEEGMTAYASDTDEFGAYNGAAWVWSDLSGGGAANVQMPMVFAWGRF